ncbi:MAG: histidine triad nucleotide-binding protein [bacterium]|nr:histidine triad nucleotide-binding protein [bacterium]
MKDCIFCKIIDKELPADILYEDNNVIVFKDIKPKAPLHILIVPKKHIPSINHLELEDKKLMGEMFLAAKKMAKKQGVAKTGYRLVFDTGKNAGQTVDHLHLHLLGGKKLPWA